MRAQKSRVRPILSWRQHDSYRKSHNSHSDTKERKTGDMEMGPLVRELVRGKVYDVGLDMSPQSHSPSLSAPHSIEAVMTEAVGTDSGRVITNHRPFLTEGSNTGKSPEVTETVIRSLVRLDRGVYWQVMPTY
ncbi:unnamed protein product [Pleuronectes platessa]|uniref:Uncharacterized protein n=1 Tax=Pleuronectes platessa TaxID=8262 RepID=A0A9N7ZB10_PLEPL|nr:unnamed protein product [Pleuronectes platessa]